MRKRWCVLLWASLACSDDAESVRCRGGACLDGGGDVDGSFDAASSSAPYFTTGFSFEPPDHSSSYRGPLYIVLRPGFQADIAQLRDAFADVVELVRWPSGERLPVETSIAPEDGGPTPYRRLRVEPRSALADGTYALRVRTVPQGTLAGLDTELIDGFYTTRFSVGSQPVVTKIEQCAKQPSKLVASISEAVRTIGTDATLSVSVNGVETPCKLSYLQVSLLAWECPTAPADASFKVRFANLEGITGVPLRDDLGGAPEYDLPAKVSASRCLEYVPWHER